MSVKPPDAPVCVNSCSSDFRKESPPPHEHRNRTGLADELKRTSDFGLHCLRGRRFARVVILQRGCVGLTAKPCDLSQPTSHQSSTVVFLWSQAVFDLQTSDLIGHTCSVYEHQIVVLDFSHEFGSVDVE